MAYNRKEKNGWALFLLVLAGIVLGGFLGELGEGTRYFDWLNVGGDFGLESPLKLDLGILFLEFRIAFKITLASLIGIAISIFVYRKL
ncbi:uncharacterized protein DUF4321 [Natranaerovirga pectinivora]|uniref:Uncharacterized protein DUF4321 n=1 Tax=Natranaerovirga pectinivora TaxID=682400 RepID=A0A4R3MLI7_9FIRM|nr:DUF4321 domain-containing protein [Natranaerovirga pectinivora]TCT14974.1 uncharacterized protein DUF4321 [Natranaerovirga pectinivora]